MSGAAAMVNTGVVEVAVAVVVTGVVSSLNCSGFSTFIDVVFTGVQPSPTPA